MDTETSEADKRKALQDLSRDLRVSLSAILACAAALGDTDDPHARHADQGALLDAIRRQGRDALRLIDGLDASIQDGTSPSENQPAAQQTNTAYVRWLRSRLEQLEAHCLAGNKVEVGQLSRQLKESAASMGYLEISEAAAAVERLSEGDGSTLQAAVEILRRIVNRAARRVKHRAA